MAASSSGDAPAAAGDDDEALPENSYICKGLLEISQDMREVETAGVEDEFLVACMATEMKPLMGTASRVSARCCTAVECHIISCVFRCNRSEVLMLCLKDAEDSAIQMIPCRWII